MTSFGPLWGGVQDPLLAPCTHIAEAAGHRPTPHRGVQVVIYRSKMLPHGSEPPKTLVQTHFLSKNSTPGPRYGRFTVSPSVLARGRQSGSSKQSQTPSWSVPRVQSSTKIVPKRFRTPKNLSPDTIFFSKNSTPGPRYGRFTVSRPYRLGPALRQQRPGRQLRTQDAIERSTWYIINLNRSQKVQNPQKP